MVCWNESKVHAPMFGDVFYVATFADRTVVDVVTNFGHIKIMTMYCV
jgi:hypothetical protein